MMKDQLQNDEIMNNEQGTKRVFDLENRTAVFAERVILFVKKTPQNLVTRPLINQVIRSSTSVGANYCEADDALTRKEFFYKISLCRKEARETKHWLRMFWTACPQVKKEAESLWREAQELNLIFSSIVNKHRNKYK